MTMYVVAFYRDGETEPFHTWAPFGAKTADAADDTVARSIARNTTAKGTLAQTARYVIREATAADFYHPEGKL